MLPSNEIKRELRHRGWRPRQRMSPADFALNVAWWLALMIAGIALGRWLASVL
jgi:hypothetical protein